LPVRRQEEGQGGWQRQGVSFDLLLA